MKLFPIIVLGKYFIKHHFAQTFFQFYCCLSKTNFIIVFIFIAFAYAHANSIPRYGWTAGQEYLYRFESQVLTGIPDINKSQYSGVKLTAQAKVQAQNDYTLRIKLDQVKFMTLNGEIIHKEEIIRNHNEAENDLKKQQEVVNKMQLSNVFILIYW